MAEKPKSEPKMAVVKAPNNFDYYILRAFCIKMRVPGFLGFFSTGWSNNDIESEVFQAQSDNAPADAVYRVKTATGPGSDGKTDKWIWRTMENLLEKATLKERDFLSEVLALSSKLASKRNAPATIEKAA
jgi:hypothetical protein